MDLAEEELLFRTELHGMDYFQYWKSWDEKMTEQHHICLVASVCGIIVHIFMNPREEMCLVCCLLKWASSVGCETIYYLLWVLQLDFIRQIWNHSEFSPLFSYQAVAKMVQQCCTYVEEITDLPVKLRLIDTLRMVTEGKVRLCFKTQCLKGRINMFAFFENVVS